MVEAGIVSVASYNLAIAVRLLFMYGHARLLQQSLESMQSMSPLLGFKFLKGKPKESNINVSASNEQQQETEVTEARKSGDGEHNRVDKSISQREQKGDNKTISKSRAKPPHFSCIDAHAVSSSNGLTLIEATSARGNTSNKQKIRTQAPAGDGYGVAAGKEKSSSCDSHGKKKSSSSDRNGKKNGLPFDQALVTRKNFSTIKNVRPNETFTNHESLPPMNKSYRYFTKVYPEYLDTLAVDEIRTQEYAYLNESGHVYLDYSGYGLFSQWQQAWQKASTSFGLSYISANLPTHALYGGADEGTVEFDIKRRVSEFLNIQESEYAMVFTASRGSAFKLLAESYPFHLKKRLLTMYDYESDAVNWMEEAAKKKGAEIISANFRWPSQSLWATDLKKKIIEKKKKKEPGKGLFVFPVQSRVTGTKYSYQWMSQAQENEWDILLDASALGPKILGSLGLSVFRPDFIVSSFFKVYGSDPTGFGCLLIKRSAIQRLHSSSAARGVGMVKLVPAPVLSEGQFEGGDEVNQKTTGEIEEEDGTSNKGFSRQAEGRQVGYIASFSGPILQSYETGEIEEEDETSNKGFSRQAEGRQVGYIASFSGPILQSYEAKSYPATALRPDKGSELQPHGTGTSNPISSELGRVWENSSSSESYARGASPLKLEQKKPSTKPLDQINENYASDDSELDDLDEVSPHDEDEGQASNLESAYDHHWRDGGFQEDQGNPAESRASTGSYSPGRNEGDSFRISQQDRLYGQQLLSTSTNIMDDHRDSSFVYSEDASSAFPYEDNDYDDVSFPFEEDDDDDDDPLVITRKEPEIICRGLLHANTLGLSRTNTRHRCLINWLVGSMLKLHHPGSQDSYHLIQIYGPKVNHDRGASVAFNLFDWRGNLLQPLLVQRLADRSNISLGVTTLHHIWLPKNSVDWPGFSEQPNKSSVVGVPTVEGHLASGRSSPSIQVITVALGFLSNFEDVYRFWAFLAKFLDADFVSKEVWRYRSLNQETVVLGMQGPARPPLY